MLQATRVTAIGTGAVLTLLSIAAVVGQGRVPRVDTLGPQVGERVPAFTLPDAGGRERSLQDLMGPKGLMLVFFRSADW